MDPKQLLNYLQENGYSYDEDEKAFCKDDGSLNGRTGSILARALGAPDEDGYRGLSPEQLRAGEPVEAMTVSLLFDPYSQPVDEAKAAAAVEFLEEREVAEGLVKTEGREIVNPIAESAAIANKSVGYEVGGRQAIWSAYISTTAGIEMGCSYVDYLAEAYHVDPTFEAVAGFGIAPSWTNPEVTAILEGRA